MRLIIAVLSAEDTTFEMIEQAIHTLSVFSDDQQVFSHIASQVPSLLGTIQLLVQADKIQTSVMEVLAEVVYKVIQFRLIYSTEAYQ